MKITSTELPAPSPRPPFPCFRRWTGPLSSPDKIRKVVLFFDYTVGVVVYPPSIAGDYHTMFINADDSDWEEWHGEVKFSS